MLSGACIAFALAEVVGVLVVDLRVRIPVWVPIVVCLPPAACLLPPSLCPIVPRLVEVLLRPVSALVTELIFWIKTVPAFRAEASVFDHD